MNAAKTDRWQEALKPQLASLATIPDSVLDAWYPRRRCRATAAATPLTAEEHYRVIDLVEQRQALRHHLTPEAFLRDWLDAEVEIKSH